MRHLALFAALAACTHSRRVSSPDELVGQQLVIASTAAPSAMPGADVPTVEEEGWFVLTPYGYVARTATREVPLTAVKSATETDHLWGALEGGGIGLAAGAGAGILLGLASGPDECDTSRGSDFCTGTDKSAADNAFILGVVFGVAGALVGLVVGGIKGTDFVYEF